MSEPQYNVNVATSDFHVTVVKRDVQPNITEVALKVYSEVTQGPMGISAYQVALDNGFIGTQEDWLESLRLKAATEDNQKILTNDGVDTYWITLEDKLNQSQIMWDLGELT